MFTELLRKLFSRTKYSHGQPIIPETTSRSDAVLMQHWQPLGTSPIMYLSLNNSLYNIISYQTCVSICYSALTTTQQTTTITHPTTHTIIPTTTATTPPHESTTQKPTTKWDCTRTYFTNDDNTDQETSVVRSMFPLYYKSQCIMHARRSCYVKNLRSKKYCYYNIRTYILEKIFYWCTYSFYVRYFLRRVFRFAIQHRPHLHKQRQRRPIQPRTRLFQQQWRLHCHMNRRPWNQLPKVSGYNYVHTHLFIYLFVQFNNQKNFEDNNNNAYANKGMQAYMQSLSDALTWFNTRKVRLKLYIFCLVD